MNKLVEVYKGQKINICSWGYCIGYDHFSTIESARRHIDFTAPTKAKGAENE